MHKDSRVDDLNTDQVETEKKDREKLDLAAKIAEAQPQLYFTLAFHASHSPVVSPLEHQSPLDAHTAQALAARFAASSAFCFSRAARIAKSSLTS